MASATARDTRAITVLFFKRLSREVIIATKYIVSLTFSQGAAAIAEEGLTSRMIVFEVVLDVIKNTH